MSDYIQLLKEAEAIVKGKSIYKRFIDGTPLSNDIAVWMADFAMEHGIYEPAYPIAPKLEAEPQDRNNYFSDALIWRNRAQVAEEEVANLREKLQASCDREGELQHEIMELRKERDHYSQRADILADELERIAAAPKLEAEPQEPSDLVKRLRERPTFLMYLECADRIEELERMLEEQRAGNRVLWEQLQKLLIRAKECAEWHIEDSDECGTHARALIDDIDAIIGVKK